MVQDYIIYNNDLTAKMFFFVVLLLYAIYMYWFLPKMEKDTLTDKLMAIFYFVYSRVIIVFFPLIVVSMLHLNVTLEELIIVTSGFYGIIMVCIFVFLIMFGFEKILLMLGISDGRVFKK